MWAQCHQTPQIFQGNVETQSVCELFMIFQTRAGQADNFQELDSVLGRQAWNSWEGAQVLYTLGFLDCMYLSKRTAFHEKMMNCGYRGSFLTTVIDPYFSLREPEVGSYVLSTGFAPSFPGRLQNLGRKMQHSCKIIACCCVFNASFSICKISVWNGLTVLLFIEKRQPGPLL